MKKILLLISTLLLTGCYDYKELNDIAIITGIGIDYYDEYQVTFEVLNTSNATEETINYEDKSVTITGTGSTFSKAFNDAINNVDEIPYFYQLQVLVIADTTAYKGVNLIFDYMLRETKINNLFYTVLTNNISTKELFKNKLPNEPIVSERIVKIIEENNNKDYEKFDVLVNKLLKEGIDISLHSITSNNNEFSINNIGVFKDDKLITLLSEHKSKTLNMLQNNYNELLLNDNENVITLNNMKSKITYKNNSLTLNFNSNATIKELKEDTNLKSNKIYDELSKTFTKQITNDIKDLLSTLNNYNTDPLGFKHTLYLYKVKENKKQTINVNIKVNKNGIIFGVIK